MPRVLMFVAVLAVTIYTVVDCLQTEDFQVRGLPKMIWVFVILLFPLAGSAAWFLAGRPHRPKPPPRRPMPRGPDDDPDFLRKL